MDPATISAGVSLVSGLMGGKKKNYTVDQTPFWLKEFPEYKEGYKQLLADYMGNQYNKPYQPAYHMRRAEATDSPYLQTIQQDLDQQIQNPQMEEAPQETPQQNPLAADAQMGRYIYNSTLQNPFAGFGTKGKGIAGFGQDGSTDADYALLARMQSLSPEDAVYTQTAPGMQTPKGKEIAQKLMAGLSGFGSGTGKRMAEWGGV